MKRRTAAWACAFLLCFGLAGCMERIFEPEAMSREEERIEDLPSVEGVILDVTEKTLILRSTAGLEYILPLLGAQVEEEETLAAGQRVVVFYKMESGAALSTDNSKKARVRLVRVAENEAIGGENRGSTADGFVVQAGMDYTTIETVGGTRYAFATANTVQAAAGGLKEGAWIRVTFDGNARPNEASNALVRGVQMCTDVPDTYLLTGWVAALDWEENVLTLRTSFGEHFRFSLEQAEDTSGGALAPGGRVCIYYTGALAARADGQKDGAQEQKLPRVLQAANARAVPVQRLDAVVTALDEASGELTVNTLDGRRLSLWPRRAQMRAAGNLAPGDAVRVTYKGELTGESTRGITLSGVQRLAGAGEIQSSVAGTIDFMTPRSLTLRADDGRTLRFAHTAREDSLAPALKAGDHVRVYFTGWLGSEDGADDTSHALVTHAALACA